MDITNYTYKIRAGKYSHVDRGGTIKLTNRLIFGMFPKQDEITIYIHCEMKLICIPSFLKSTCQFYISVLTKYIKTCTELLHPGGLLLQFYALNHVLIIYIFFF